MPKGWTERLSPWVAGDSLVRNVDKDLFGRALRGAMYQPSDEAAGAEEGCGNDAEMADYVCEQLILRAHKDAMDAGRSTPAFV